MRQKPRAFRRGRCVPGGKEVCSAGLAARPACLSVKRRGMAGKTVTKNDNTVTFLTVPGKIPMIKSVV